MASIVTLSMVCFPYVMMGLGQAIIASTNLPERKVDKTDDIRGWRIRRRTFEKATSHSEDRTLWAYPILSPHWGKA